MEALWNLEDKWNLSTGQAVLLFVCAASLVIGLCTATAIRKRVTRNKVDNKQDGHSGGGHGSERSGLGSVKKALMRSIRWSKGKKWEDQNNLRASRKEQPVPLLLQVRGGADEVGWQSHNSVSPVWQRRILMGEKCEMPRFSGLILYDERGRPLDQYHPANTTIHHLQGSQEDHKVRTTLRDLL